MSKLPSYDFASLYPNTKTLSSSQFLCYEKDPKDFYVKYVLGANKTKSVAMSIGSIFSALYADRQIDFRKLLQEAGAPKRIADLFEQVIKRFPMLKNGNAEFPMICEHNGWKFRATLDGFVEEYHTIIENKTGQVEWTQERANFTDQITFQAWTHWKKYKIPPRKILVNWVNTKANANKPVHSFNTSRSIKNLKMFERRVDVVLENLEAGNFTKQIYV